MYKNVLPSDEVSKNRKTVLYVDDDEMILDICKDILKELGYGVFTARGGREAVDVYKKNMDMIDLVILDMIMPDMNGSKTYDILKFINPNIKVLLASGYCTGDQVVMILKRGCDGFIAKPFKVEQLSQKIRDILRK